MLRSAMKRAGSRAGVLVGAAVGAAVVGLGGGCVTSPTDREPEALGFGPAELEVVAESPRYRWTGVAVLSDPSFYERPHAVQPVHAFGGVARDRIFVNFPHWNERAPWQVAEIMEDGSFRAYPDAAWQQWSPGDDPSERFVCVQSVHVDLAGRLWVLDTGAPGFAGPVEGGAKLVQIDPATDEVVRVYRFDDTVAPQGSYLNDVRVALGLELAVMTDSGRGGLVVLNLRTGRADRMLDRSPLTTSDPMRDGGAFAFRGVLSDFLLPDGGTVQIHSDGLEILPTRDTSTGAGVGDLVVWQSITGTTLRAAKLTDLWRAARSDDPDAALADTWIHEVTGTPVSDGLIYDRFNGALYFSALEGNAVTAISRDAEFGRFGLDDSDRARRTSAPAQSVTPRFSHPGLQWPDSFALGAKYGYVTSARIHLETPFEHATAPAEPHRLFRFRRR